jgi:predicted dehydrogenase
VEHFANCVRTGATPLTDGVHGRSVVAILEAAERSSSRGGIPVVVDGVRVPVVSAA